MSFLETLGQTVKNSVLCPLAQANSALAGSAANAFERAGVRGSQIPLIPNAIQAAVCPIPQFVPPNLPPFNGGQCPTNYQITISYSYENLLLNGQWEPRQANSVFGAIGPVTPLGEERVELPTGSPCGSQATQVNYRFQVGQNQSPLIRNVFSEYNCGTFIGGVRNVAIDNISVVRVDGQPDNCGDPPPIPPPVIPPIGLPPVPINFDFAPDINNPSLTVNASGTVIVSPVFINARGELNVPVSINLDVNNQGDILPIEANVNISTGGFTINTGGSPNNRTPGDENCDPDATEPTEEPPPSPEDEGPAEQERPDEGEEVIVGVLVTVNSVTLTNRATVIGQDGNPDIYAPALGYVNFLCRTGSGPVGGWLPDQPVKNRRCLIPCLWPYGAIEVRGTPLPGVSWTLTPIRDRRKTPREVLLQ